MTDWSKLKVVDLKAELKKRGLPQAGLKQELVARLVEAENATENEVENESPANGDAPGAVLNSAAAPEEGAHSPKPSSSSAAPAESTGQSVQLQDDQIDLSATEPTPTAAIQPETIIGSSKAILSVDSHASPLPSVEPQEAIEDRQRRKRRSLTPPISTDDVARKRLRTGENENVNASTEEEIKTSTRGVATSSNSESAFAASGDAAADRIMEEQPSTSGLDAESPSRRRDSRFKGLFEANQPSSATEESLQRDSAPDDVEHDHTVEPAIHPATSALYIRDFMRPLNQQQLKSHLATLATPPNSEVDEDLVLSFYIDPIRTHAFVSFTSVSAAVRVRSALHGSVWPAERNRKPLWVDFIPADKVDDWIDQEKAAQAGGRSAAKKWEVVYHNIDSDQLVEAALEEASDHASAKQVAPTQSSISAPPAPDDRSATDFERAAPQLRAPPQRSPYSEPRNPNSFSTLDQLFNSTRTKPVLYWQPVSKTLANKRLDAIDDATSKDPSRGVGGDINRYTFEDGGILVDRGPEIFPGIRPPPGYRGPARGGGRGGFPSRGGRGGTYDSYRGGAGPRDSARWDRRDSRDDRYHY